MIVSRSLHHLLVLLARAAHLPGPPRSVMIRPKSEIDPWPAFAALAREHQLEPFLGGHRWVLGQFVPANLTRRFHHAHLANAQRSAFRHLRLIQICELVAPAVVLKGAALSLVLYPQLADRAMSDLDILLCEPARAAEHIAALGLEKQGEDKLGHHHLAPLHDPTSDLTVELHVDLTTPPLPEGVLRELIARRISAGRVDVFDLEGRILHQALHLCADPIDSPLLRNVFELAWMISRLDSAAQFGLERDLERWDLMDRAAPALRLAADLFGVPLLAPASPKGAIDHLCRLRLEWTDRFLLEQPLWERLKRDVAQRTLAEPDSDEALFGPLLRAGAKTMRRAGESFFAPSTHESLIPIACDTARVGEGLLAYDRTSGAVHLLSPLVASVFEALTRDSNALHVAARLASSGVSKQKVGGAIAALIERGLVR